MASLTASYLLFLEAAKEYGWPIEDEKFFRAVTVGFFAPDILRFALGDKQAGNIESKGRRITHFCGGKMIYPKIEELKDTIINHKERFYAEAFPGFENFKLVDPKIEIPVFMENNKYLFNENIDNQAYAMGLYAALEIDKEFDYIVHQKQFHFNGLKVYTRTNGSEKGEQVSKIRSILNTVYPRMDKQLIERSEVDQDFFDRVYGILAEHYPADLLEKAVKPYWRMPEEKDMRAQNRYQELIINRAFNQDILDYFYGESTAKLGKVDRFKSVVSNLKKAKKTRPDATSFEDAVSPERQAKVDNLKEVPKAFQTLIPEELKQQG